jgi:YcxB-like protein
MTVQFAYDKKQVIQALRYHFLMRPEIKVLLILVNVFAIASAILFSFKKIQALSFLVFSLLWFFLMLVIWRLLPGSIYRKSMTFQDHFIMHFQDDAVVLETEKGSKGWYWNKFSHFVESPYFFHLYFDARSFFLVPKDSFDGITELQEVRSMLREKIGKKG